MTSTKAINKIDSDKCPVHVIWTGRQMAKLVLNVKYLLLLSFLTLPEFYNLGPIQGITYKGALTQKR